jgi:hypothetical protein
MDSERLDELLINYWSGQTSLEEERELHLYFRRPDIPEPLKETAQLFRYFDQQHKRTITDASFQRRVIKKFKGRKNGKINVFIFNAMRIAAGIIVLVVAIWLVRIEIRKSAMQQTEDTYTDPKVAFEETKKALMMISKSFGTAEEQAKKINLFNKAQQDVRKEETTKDL